jgi:REP element-mobilizing transposase RayT
MKDLRPTLGMIVSPPRFGEVTVRDRGRLPHWEKDSGLYFITFRLLDSLPQSVLQKLEAEAKSSTANLPISTAKKAEQERVRTRLIERYLDRGSGSCSLRNPQIASMVADALRFGNDRDYRLFGWCVMPNHVHVVIRLLPGRKLSTILHSWKSFTAKKANQLLGRMGPFWQREYYDHLIRNGEEFDAALKYVQNNPAKAGLKNWQWVEICGQDAHTTAGETPALL